VLSRIDHPGFADLVRGLLDSRLGQLLEARQ
jgi:hypothetical protein